MTQTNKIVVTLIFMPELIYFRLNFEHVFLYFGSLNLHWHWFFFILQFFQTCSFVLNSSPQGLRYLESQPRLLPSPPCPAPRSPSRTAADSWLTGFFKPLNGKVFKIIFKLLLADLSDEPLMSHSPLGVMVVLLCNCSMFTMKVKGPGSSLVGLSWLWVWEWDKNWKNWKHYKMHKF